MTVDMTAPPVPMSRLVRVEMRKMMDTRAGFWLLMTIVILTALALLVYGLIMTFAVDTGTPKFGEFFAMTGTPQGFLLPVLGILLITHEWGQRTAMATFTLEPRRIRVLLAKFISALIWGLLAILIAAALAALATLAFQGDFESSFSELNAFDEMLRITGIQLLAILQGIAFGLLFLASAAAIVTYFVLPTVSSVIAGIWPWWTERAAWFDLGTAQVPLFEGATITAEQWAQLVTSSLIWIGLPMAIGIWRVLRSEMK